MKVPLTLHIIVTLHVIKPVWTNHLQSAKKCELKASELGPDWYKVPQPVPIVFAENPDMAKSYVHMPCAADTVFDVAVCGCTNLLTFLYTTLGRGETRDSTSTAEVPVTAPPGDWVKTNDPRQTTKAPPTGSLLLNTRTGEIRRCPFRASSRGPAWYLMHEPTEVWRPMRCAPGTLFYKKHCTCVHAGTINNEDKKAEDANIVVLEEEYNLVTGESNTISQALGISTDHVDFRRKVTSNNLSGREENTKRQSNNKEYTKHNNTNITLTKLQGSLVVDNLTVPLGTDAISQQHKQRLLKKGLIPLIRKGVSTLTIDSKEEKMTRKVNFVKVESKQDLLALDKMIEKMKEEKSSRNSKDLGAETMDQVVIFAHKECSRRPIPELGPQFFQLYIWGFGLVPYVCNGDRVYDDKKCACVLAPRNASFDEVQFPVTAKCHKKAIPELGVQYFKMYQWGYGYTPYRCHQHLVFNPKLCACVKP